MERSVREKEREEGGGGRDSCFWDDAIGGETVNGGYEDLERGGVLNTGHVVDCVEDDIEDDGIIGQ